MNTYTFHINLYDIVFLGTIFTGLTFILQLWFAKRTDRNANRFLALALTTVVLWIARVFAIDVRLDRYFPHWSWLPLQFSLALGPLIYFYVLKLTRPEYKLRWKDLLHLAPLLLQQGILVLEIAESAGTGAASYNTPAFRQTGWVLQLLTFISAIIYLYYSFKLIERFYRRLKFNAVSDRHRYELRWLNRLLMGIGLVGLLWILYTVFYYFYYHQQLGIRGYYPLYLLLAMVIIRAAASACFRPEIAVPVQGASVSKPLPPAMLKQKGIWLKEAVKAGLYYQDPELSLNSLADKLGLGAHELSRIINTVLKKSFSDFINEFRVADFVQKMQDPANDHITLLGIAFESGFNSKTTFNRAFKQMTGKSPAEYKNQLKKERPYYNTGRYARFATAISFQEATRWSFVKLKRNHMIKNYFKIAWRNLVRQRLYSLINIGGLAVGMAVAIIIGLWIYDELTFNRYHQNYDRIARVMRHETWHGETGTGASQTMPMGYSLRSLYGNDFKYVVMSTWTEGHVLSFGDKKFTQQGNYMQAEGPEMLTLDMVAGTRSGLKGLNSILLNASTAKKLFGGSDPLNQVIKIDNNLVVKVTGVYADIPANSEFKDMSFVAPWDLLISSNEWLKQHQNDWNNQFLQILTQINPNTTFNKVSEKIKDITLNHVSGDVAAAKPSMFLHPMSQWHLYSKFTNGVNVTSDTLKYVWFYGTIGMFVLLLACINFMNLSTARSEKRAREVGVRKVMGSVRTQLVGQFYCESILVSGLSFALAMGLVELSLPWFNGIASKNMSVPLQNLFFLLTVISFILVTGFLAGSYPALYLSSFNPVKALKGVFKVGRFAAVPRKVLVVVQYTVSIALMIGTLVVYRQVQFTKNRPVGYSRNGLLTVQMLSPDYKGKFEVLRNELKSTGTVAGVAASVSPVTGIWRGNGGFVWKGKDPKMMDNFGTLDITAAYGKTIGWRITGGRDFSETSISDSLGIVVNEAAVKYMGLNNPVGQYVRWERQGKTFKILGVVRDMVMDSPFKPAYPTLFFLQNNANWLFIKIRPSVSASTALTKIEAVFKKIVPSAPFDYKFVDDDYAAKFAAEERVSKLAGAFSVLAIFIICIGLFGMASFTAEQRIKEIGMRKILGASVFTLWRLLSRDFLMLVIISMLIAAPIARYFMQGWLQSYEYRVPLSWWIFAVAGAGAMLITLLTVSYQSIKTALANPVRSLRSE